jgi:carbamate kinase
MRIVVALGGNALSPANRPFDIDVQRARIRTTADHIAALCRTHEVVVTHGNGPQVGHLASLALPGRAPPAFPLDIVNAATDALIGYEIERALRSTVPDLPTATLLTMVEIDPADPAFTLPSKPIGPVYPTHRRTALERRRGWVLQTVPGGVRRVVASPQPIRILEAAAVGALLDSGHLVIACGGGGIPVVRDGSGLQGADAVIDKDRVSAMLAREIGADALLLLTDVDGIYRDWPAPMTERIGEIDAATLAGLRFDAGSMGPKAEAACAFARTGRGFAAIGRLDDLPRLAEGRAGTIVAGT